MTTQLSLYNGSLRAIGERKLASLSENREPRRLLDDVWTGAIKTCLEEADWKFAQRTAKLVYDPSYTATFGYLRRFTKPADCVRWSKVCTDEYQNTPLTAYAEEAGFLFSDLDEIYVSYVSDDSSYGSDMSLWPESFVAVVELYLAAQIISRIEQSKTNEAEMEKKHARALTNAKSKDAIQGPTKFLPTGSWVASRGVRRSDDRGNRGQLIG